MDIALDARRGQIPRSSTSRAIFLSGDRVIFLRPGLIRLADDNQVSQGLP
jgi:hypothetical protein